MHFIAFDHGRLSSGISCTIRSRSPWPDRGPVRRAPRPRC
jgi:hypothetical protein